MVKPEHFSRFSAAWSSRQCRRLRKGQLNAGPSKERFIPHSAQQAESRTSRADNNRRARSKLLVCSEHARTKASRSRSLASGRMPHGKPVSNIILLSISDSDYSSLRPHLEYVSLPNHLVLHEAGGKLEFAYFPNRGLISLVVVMKDGKTAEAGIVGNEGFTGTPAAVGLSRSPLQAVVQITGDGFRVEVAALQNTLESTPHLQLMLSRYAVVQGMQVAQTAACNRLHDIKQRLARWLLMTQDRVDSESLPITHDFLATMLGTDRPTVSLAAGVLQREEAHRVHPWRSEDREPQET